MIKHGPANRIEQDDIINSIEKFRSKVLLEEWHNIFFQTQYFSGCFFLFDAQISRSGELAGFTRHKLKEYKISGEAKTSKIADFELKTEGGNPERNVIVATSDGIIIDSVKEVLDIPACLMEKMRIEPVRLY